VNLGIERATARHINSLIASYSLARAKPAPAYSDTFLATFQHDYILSPKYRIVSQTSFLRDPPKTITKHTEQLIGFARTLVQTPSTTFMVAPGLAYSFGEKEYVGDVTTNISATASTRSSITPFRPPFPSNRSSRRSDHSRIHNISAPLLP